MTTIQAVSTSRKSPFKQLFFYTTTDADVFFGRSSEIERLGSMVYENRVTLLNGASGTGKTSLLLAGVIPFLSNSDKKFKCVDVRMLTEPDKAIRDAVSGQLPNQARVAEIVGQETPEILPGFRLMIEDVFNKEDLKTLCFTVGIDIENLEGTTKTSISRELILECKRRNRLPQLLEACRRLRPDVQWPEELSVTKIEPVSNFQELKSLDGSLRDFIGNACTIFDCTLVLFLDQFEEFFIRNIDRKGRAKFIKELAALYNSKDVPVKIVFSLREDWLASVQEIEEWIPEVFLLQNRMRLLPLTREQAQEAIEMPFKKVGITFEQGLVQRLVGDLVGEVETAVLPPQLQIVCNALFTNLSPAETILSHAGYDSLGGTKGILQNYLENVLDSFPSEQRPSARAVLEELVTSQGTKAVKTTNEIAQVLNLPEDDLENLMKRLVVTRLVRVLDREEGGIAYELAHEYLIRDISLSQETIARKEAEELLRGEVADWKRYGTLIPVDKLARIDKSRAMLRPSTDAGELLLRSAMYVKETDLFWLKRMADEEKKAQTLLEIIQDDKPDVRKKAASSLKLAAQDAQRPEDFIRPLLKLAITDPDSDVQKEAKGGLVELSKQNHLHEVIHQELPEATTYVNESKEEGAFLALLGEVKLPLILLPIDVRKKFVSSWFSDWFLGTIKYWIAGLFSAFIIIGGIAWLTEKLNFPTDTFQPFLDIFAIGFILFLAGAVMTERQIEQLERLIVLPGAWLAKNNIAWLLVSFFVAWTLETEWPLRLFANQSIGQVFFIETIALAICLIVSTVQGVVIRKQGYRYPWWRLWFWVLVFGAILSVIWFVVAQFSLQEQAVVFLIGGLLGLTILGISAPVSIGLWLSYYIEKDTGDSDQAPLQFV